MKEVHIECAGAGKTYGIARKIIDILDDCPVGKNIYAVTYTNYAVKQIKDELILAIKDVPNNVVIKTVHSFLLDNIIYPYSSFVKGESINTCSVEELTGKPEWKAKRKRVLKDSGVIHSSDVAQYARSLLVTMSGDKVTDKKRKGIVIDYFISDIYCLFVDEAQDLDGYLFDLMLKVICRLEHYYFVGDPFQALWAADKYKEFTERIAEQEGIAPSINTVSRRIPACIVPLCNRILPEGFALSSINESGLIEYIFLSELDNTERRGLASANVFSYIKTKTDIFLTATEHFGLTQAFKQILTQKYPAYDVEALCSTVKSRIIEVGLDKCLMQLKIRLSKQDYAELASRFCRKNEAGIIVEAIQKIKGLENDTAYFIVCNSLLELLLGVKNDLNKETNFLYVALTRTKRRLLFVIDDDDGLKLNFQKRKIDINAAMGELGIKKAVIKDWLEGNVYALER